MTGIEIIIILAALFNFILGFFVYIKEPSKKINRLFGIFGFITAIWIFPNFFVSLSSNPFWIKFGYAFGALVPLSAMLWVAEICERKINKREIFIFSCIGILFFIVSFVNNLIIASITRVYPGGFEGTTGPLFLPYWIYMIGLLAFIVYVLASSYYKAVGAKKLQIVYVLGGAVLYISTVLITSFILPLFKINKFIPLDSPSSIFLVLFTAFAITRVNLFEIRVILTEALVIVTGLALLIQAVIAETVFLKVLGGVLFGFFIIFGYRLVRSVIKEIELRAKLEVLYGELKKLDDAKSEFIAIASHQLRSPLTAVKGYVSMILENSYGDIPKEMNQPLKNVYASNERLINLVNDILNISKIEAGKMEMELENTSLEELILDIMNELKVKADARKLYLKYIKPTVPAPLVMVDKTKMRQIIMNLIDNSIKYTEKGGTTIKLLKLDSKLRIEISDTGMGIDKEYVGKLFESFSRANVGSRTHPEGTGLGLYIARKYIEMHKGRVWAESPGKGKGSSFFIELPIK